MTLVDSLSCLTTGEVNESCIPLECGHVAVFDSYEEDLSVASIEHIFLPTDYWELEHARGFASLKGGNKLDFSSGVKSEFYKILNVWHYNLFRVELT